LIWLSGDGNFHSRIWSYPSLDLLTWRSIATKQDVETHFAMHGGKIKEIKLMNGFGFIEFEEEMDARDIVPSTDTVSLLPKTY
jgi:hypothetical protein